MTPGWCGAIVTVALLVSALSVLVPTFIATVTIFLESMTYCLASDVSLIDTQIRSGFGDLAEPYSPFGANFLPYFSSQQSPWITTQIVAQFYHFREDRFSISCLTNVATGTVKKALLIVHDTTVSVLWNLTTQIYTCCSHAFWWQHSENIFSDLINIHMDYWYQLLVWTRFRKFAFMNKESQNSFFYRRPDTWDLFMYREFRPVQWSRLRVMSATSQECILQRTICNAIKLVFALHCLNGLSCCNSASSNSM